MCRLVALRKRGCAWVADVADMYPACEMSERLLKLLRKFQDFQSEHAVDTTSPLQIVTASKGRDRWLRVRDFEPVAHSGPAELADAYQSRSVGASPVGPRRLLPVSLRTPQRNRNELVETTVNKTWRKHAAAIEINNLEDIHCVRNAGAEGSTNQVTDVAQPAKR